MTKLEPGPHIGAPYGIYQQPMTIELALSLGWSPPDTEQLTTLIDKANAHLGMCDLVEEDYETMQDALEEAIDWINGDGDYVPEGYWFGHHPDFGDMGVWLLDDMRACDTCGKVTDAGDYPDWTNGECETCDPTILNT